jgi:oxygen-independent coproporphyrinogen-3 oxidase
VLASIGESFAIDISGVPEVALEVAPDTVDATKLRDIRDVGITRINIGLQSANEREIKLIGRQHGFERARRTIEDSLNIGFRNVCVDLIYGLPGQSVGEWVRTLDEVLKLAPPTVCAYPLTLRPGTGFSRQNLNIYGPDQYQKYEIAKTRLQDVGYAQETHVRYIVPGHGGYRQKMNHWAGQDVIGIGAGARGYLRTVDYRNGYSLKKRKDALTGYYSDISAFASPIHSAMNHNRDERLRRSIILGLFHLDRGDFVATHGTDVIAAFSDEFFELDSLGLVQMNQQTVSLTEFGRKYRDLVVQRFFSNDVWERVRRFNYNE